MYLRHSKKVCAFAFGPFCRYLSRLLLSFSSKVLNGVLQHLLGFQPLTEGGRNACLFASLLLPLVGFFVR